MNFFSENPVGSEIIIISKNTYEFTSENVNTGFERK